MRLIRLTSTDENGLFECNFNEDLIFNENTSIALHSFTTQFPNSVVDINNTNNKIIYSVDGEENKKIVFLEEGVYDVDNIGNLFFTTTNRLNTSFNLTENEVSKQWKVKTDALNSGKVQFSLKRGLIGIAYVGENTARALSRSKNVSTSNDPKTFQRGGGTSGTTDSFLYWSLPASKGASSIRLQFYENTGGFILGYLSENPNDNTNSIDTTKIIYGIEIAGATYKYWLNGVATAVAITVEPDDRLYLDIENGVVSYNIVRSGGTTENIFNATYDHYTDLYAVNIFKGNTVMKSTNFTMDPFYSNTQDDSLDTSLIELVDSSVPIFPGVDTDNFLEFGSINLANQLGFINTRYPTTGFIKTKNYDYIGENAFRLRDYIESYIIELLNIKIDSYDSMSNQRRNFLSVVPKIDLVKDHVVYVAPNLIFLDLNNEFKQNYRTIRARILRDDLSQVQTYGLSNLTILVKDEPKK